ncbi:MAG: hypothetical protein FWG11_00020 [Promicromonosporaceae bacterium]|nr:hypothetical protein [Promicromonosporaceae bacterium]
MLTPTVHFNVYRLKKGVDPAEFLAAFDELVAREISASAGFVSADLLSDGDTYVDLLRFETAADLATFEAAAADPSEPAQRFYSFINFTAKGGRHAKLQVLRGLA